MMMSDSKNKPKAVARDYSRWRRTPKRERHRIGGGERLLRPRSYTALSLQPVEPLKGGDLLRGHFDLAIGGARPE